MILIKTQGGLGNQLFQYALGRTLAKINNTTLKLDISEYTEENKRTFQLPVFNTVFEVASEEEIEKFIPKNKFQRKLKKTINSVLPIGLKNYFIEKDVSFKPEILKIKNNTYAEGYFPHPEYFSSIEPILRQELTLKDSHNKNLPVFEKVRNAESVSIHVRRGDYTSIKGGSLILPLEYYYKAITYIQERYPNAQFFVISDDTEWCKNNIKVPENTYFVSPSDNLTDPEELILMSCCKHNIIANSTFSFWAAWLNSNPEKIVITPKDWLHPTDPSLPEWIRI